MLVRVSVGPAIRKRGGPGTDHRSWTTNVGLYWILPQSGTNGHVEHLKPEEWEWASKAWRAAAAQGPVFPPYPSWTKKQ